MNGKTAWQEQALAPDGLPMILPTLSLLEANAGNGKTYTLISIVLRLIILEGMSCDQIYLITFTRAATRQLKDRLIDRFQRAAAVLRAAFSTAAAQSLKSDPNLEAIYLHLREGHPHLDSQGVLRQMQGRIDQAAVQLNRVQISTLDSFLLRFCRENSYQLGLIAAPDIDLEQKALTYEAAQRVWLQQIEKFQASYYLTNLPRRADLKTSFLQFAQARKQVDSWSQQYPGLALQVPEESLNLSQAMAARAKVHPQGTDAPERFEKILLEGSRFDNQSARRIAEFRDISGYQMTGKRNALRALLEARGLSWHQRAYTNEKVGLSQVLASAFSALEQVKAGNLRLFAKVMVIDECQDNSEMQHQLLLQIQAKCQGQGLRMCFVGDPKQQIYSYRGASLAGYRQVSQQINEKRMLKVNRRHSPALLNTLNALFEVNEPELSDEWPLGCRYIPSELTEEMGQMGPDFHDSDAHQRLRRVGWQEAANSPQIGDGMTLVVPPASPFGNLSNAEEYVLQRCCSDISSMLAEGRAGRLLLGNHPVVAKDLAVLVHRNEQAERIYRQLTSLGIDAQLGGQTSLLGNESSRALVSLIEATMEGQMDLVSLALCRLLALQVHLGDVQRSSGVTEKLPLSHELVAAACQRHLSYRGTWQKHGILALIYRYLAEEPWLRDLRPSRAWEGLKWQWLAIAEHFIRQDAASTNDPRLFLHLLREKDGIASSSPKRQICLDQDSVGVQVETIHAAKGKEYPIVFLPLMWRASIPFPKEGEFVVAWQEKANVPAVVADLEAQSKWYSHQVAESRRLAYVAMTRACNLCRLYLAETKKSRFASSDLATLFLTDAQKESRASLMDALEPLRERLQLNIEQPDEGFLVELDQNDKQSRAWQRGEGLGVSLRRAICPMGNLQL